MFNMTYSDLLAYYPAFTHFYKVNNLTLPDAMERCARMTGDEGHVVQINGETYFTVKHEIGNDNDWLTLVAGTPVDADVTEL